MKHRSLFFAAVLAALVFCIPTSGLAKDEWISVRSKNFHLVGNATEKDIRQVATKLEQFRETFRVLFPGMKVTSPIPSTVIVFKNNSSYRPYKPKLADGKPDDGIAGYFQSGEDVNYITLSTERQSGEHEEDRYGTIFHEYVHFMLDTSFGKTAIPTWLNEGLAEYYQTFQIVNDQQVTVGYTQEGHLRLLSQSKLIPLKQFFEVSNYSLHATGGHSRSIFYAQAWALIHYFMQGNQGANLKGLSRFITLVARDVEPEAAFKQAFNSDYAAMEKELRKYIEDNKYTATRHNLPQKLVFDSQMTVTPLSEAMTNAYLGDLLLHTRELPAAETHLQKALTLDANLSMAHTSLGLVKLRQRNFAEAKKHLERAIADDQRNHFAHYNFAVLLSRESVDEFGFVQNFPPEALKRMRESLLKAIEINPQFAESYRMLGFVSLVSGENLDEALKIVNKGLAIQPGNPDYLLLTAKIMMRQEKFDQARAIAEKVSKATDKQEVRAEADDLLKSISQIAEAKAAYEKRIAEARAAVTSSNGISVQVVDQKPLIFLKRKDLSDAEVAQIEKDRENQNLNRLLEVIKPGEQRVVGRIEKIECARGIVRFRIKTENAALTLSATDFQSLHMSIFKEGTQNFEIGCRADLSSELIVATYRPPQKAVPGVNGELVSLAFMPADFRMMTEKELAESRQIIIEGGPPTDLTKNAETAAKEQADFEQKRREAMLRQLQLAVRQPLAGETRVMGTVDKIECSGNTMSANISTASGPLKFRIAAPKDLVINIYTPDADGLEFGCGVSIPGLRAVITYVPAADNNKYAGDLKAIEFVPPAFQLP